MAMIKKIRRTYEVGVLPTGVSVHEVGPQLSKPVMLISSLNSYGGSGLEVGIRVVCRLSIDSQPGGVLDITRNPVTVGSLKNKCVSAKRLEACGCVESPSENRIGPAVRQERPNRPEDRCDLHVAPFEFIAYADRAIRGGGVRLC